MITRPGYYWATDDIGHERELIQFGDGIVTHFGIQGGSSQFAYHDYTPVASEADVEELVEALEQCVEWLVDYGFECIKARELIAKYEAKS